MTVCRILLTPLKSGEEMASGYSAKGLKALAGSTRTNTQLGFTRSEFIQKLPERQRGMSISGYQPKLQMILQNDAFAVVDHQGQFILKPSPDEFPHLAENEHATMSVMARLGFNVPVNGLLPFMPASQQDKPEYAFVIRRFDRDGNGEPIHQEQLDAAMNIMEKYGKIGSDGKQFVSYERIAQFLVKQVNNNVAFKRDLFRRIAYAYLLGNNDLHLRNFGLLLPRDNPPQLSPVYDFVSVAPYRDYFNASYLALPLLIREEGEQDIAPGFNTAYGEYLGMDFLLLGESLGLNPRLTTALLHELSNESQIVESTYRRSFMPEEDIAATLRCYHQRLSRLQLLYAPSL
ncbi:HipA domain-containing protein [Pantoea coffeiphila]|uniref:HipA domain-containing protein n=1 Tax=Pantoea coffeiphila TaxID=1465635 RepID=UPI00195FCAC1